MSTKHIRVLVKTYSIRESNKNISMQNLPNFSTWLQNLSSELELNNYWNKIKKNELNFIFFLCNKSKCILHRNTFNESRFS